MGYDVLLYISDQHAAACNGFMGDDIVETPFLDSLAERSFVFDNALTSCPLCVPARASLMTSRLPSKLGVFDNSCDFKSSEVTFAHLHAIKGYDCTLIGRMHFMGLDQMHGFTNRLSVDFSPNYWGYPSEKRDDMGDFGRSLYQKWCLEVVGTGDSPVLDYDRMVVDEALRYLGNDFDKPQFMVVGTYAPHFPYVADGELVNKYIDKIRASYKKSVPGEYVPPLASKMQHASDDKIIALRAAYYAMIETMDRQVESVYRSYQEYLVRNKRKGIFIYMSDHGDQIGDKDFYGKQTFFDKSIRIPLVMEVPGYKGRRIETPVSIMDVGPTLCELNNTLPYPSSDGKPFTDLFYSEDKDRYVVSEYYDAVKDGYSYGRMLFSDGCKLISYKGFENGDLLFDLHNDFEESVNLIKQKPDVYAKLKTMLDGDERLSDRGADYLSIKRNHQILGLYGKDRVSILNRCSYYVPVKVRKLGKKLF